MEFHDTDIAPSTKPSSMNSQQNLYTRGHGKLSLSRIWTSEDKGLLTQIPYLITAFLGDAMKSAAKFVDLGIQDQQHERNHLLAFKSFLKIGRASQLLFSTKFWRHNIVSFESDFSIISFKPCCFINRQHLWATMASATLTLEALKDNMIATTNFPSASLTTIPAQACLLLQFQLASTLTLNDVCSGGDKHFLYVPVFWFWWLSIWPPFWPPNMFYKHKI